MRQSAICVFVTGLALLFCSSCGDELDPGISTPIEERENFVAILAGSNVVAPVETSATGTASFRVEAGDGSYRISYTLRLTGIPGITEVAIHAGAEGQNGERLALLCGVGGSSCTGGEASGFLEAASLSGAPDTLSSLRNRMREGTAYVSVSTHGHPEGELRGQIQSMERPCGFGDRANCDPPPIP